MNDYETIYTPSAEVLPAEQETETFTRTDRLTAFAMLLGGFLFVRFGMYHVAGLLTTLVVWGILTAELLFLKHKGITLDKGGYVMAVVLYVFAAVYTVTASTLLKTLDTVFLVLTGCLFLFRAAAPGKAVFAFLPLTLSKAIFTLPFLHFGKAFRCIVSGKTGRNWKQAGLVLLGFLLAVPMTLVVAGLLCSADPGVNWMLKQLFHAPQEELATLFPHLLVGIPIGAGMFSVLWSAASKSVSFTEEDGEDAVRSCRFLPCALAYAAVTPICLLYVLYIVSQMGYFLGGFTGETGEMNYADYARQGFFELCAVCCINLSVIACLGLFTKRSGEERPMPTKLYNCYLCVCSLFIAGTAIAKMCLYIRVYGLTELRVYTTWFMVLLVIGFGVLAVRQFVKLPVGKIAAVTFTVMFALLCFSRPQKLIVSYNAKQYLAGHIAEFDITIVEDMSLDAVAGLMTFDEATRIRLAEAGHATLWHCPDVKDLDFYESLNLSAWEVMLRD